MEREGRSDRGSVAPRVRQVIYAGPDALAKSPVTRTILFACAAVFAGEVLATRSAGALLNVPDDVALAFGANAPSLTLGLGHVERLLASCFLHGSLLHIAFNMYTLRQVGPLVEPTVGSGRYASMYVLTGIAASLASAFVGELIGRTGPSVGASGAICGVMGAAVVVAARVEGWRSGIAWQIGFWLVVNLVIGATMPKIDNAAHVGGLVAGCVIAMMWRRGVTYSAARTAVYVGAAAALCLASGAVVAWRDRTDPYTSMDANARTALVLRALKAGDCAEARRAMAATEALGKDRPDVEGVREAVEERCPR